MKQHNTGPYDEEERRGRFKYLTTNNLERYPREVSSWSTQLSLSFLSFFLSSILSFFSGFHMASYVFLSAKSSPPLPTARSLPSRRVWFTHKALASIKKTSVFVHHVKTFLSWKIEESSPSHSFFFFLKEIIEYLPALVIGECKRLCSRLKDFRSYREKQAMSNIVNSGKAILNRGTKR